MCVGQGSYRASLVTVPNTYAHNIHAFLRQDSCYVWYVWSFFLVNVFACVEIIKAESLARSGSRGVEGVHETMKLRIRHAAVNRVAIGIAFRLQPSMQKILCVDIRTTHAPTSQQQLQSCLLFVACCLLFIVVVVCSHLHICLRFESLLSFSLIKFLRLIADTRFFFLPGQIQITGNKKKETKKESKTK